MDDDLTTTFALHDLYDPRQLPTPTPYATPRKSVMDAILGVRYIRLDDALRSMDKIAEAFDRLAQTLRWDGRWSQGTEYTLRLIEESVKANGAAPTSEPR